MKRSLAITVLLAFMLAPIGLAISNASPKGVPNSNASGYWTEERRNSAQSREFVFDQGSATGRLVPQAKKSTGGGGAVTSSGTYYWPASNQSQLVAQIVGKVFFTMGATNYVCSGSLINDGSSTFAIVVTAGHCIFDQANQSFATNWSFWPNYDTDYANRQGWFATKLFAHPQFTAQTSFNTTAIKYDFAFARVDSADSRVNPASLPSIAAPGFTSGAIGYAFGYPQASPFNGQELVYSTGSVGSDSNIGGATWKIPSTLTGGASGGPWYSSYSNGNSVGSVSSLNSYRYSTDTKNMYGPKFNSSTTELMSASISGSCTGYTGCITN